MKKQLLIVVITLILLAVGLSGCNEKGIDILGKSNEEKILGTWGIVVSEDEETPIYSFFSNGTFSVSAMMPDFWSKSATRQTIWGTYVMTDETLAMNRKGDAKAFEYSFSDNGKKLTLIDVEQGGQFAVLTKYDSPPQIPSIQFIKNDIGYIFTLTVSAVDPSNVPWSNIEITGTCDTSGLGTYVAVGDMITDCSGTLTIRDVSTNILLGSWTLSGSLAPNLAWTLNDAEDTITITSGSSSDTYGASSTDGNLMFKSPEGTYYVKADLSLSTLETGLSTAPISAGDIISGFSPGTWHIIWVPTDKLLGTLDFS
ncbi:MAG: hypothetical protein KAW45_00115 [Thermoplasmatales archaeon]|nr:hypothetical protein [Thermoplasmatales archaeon]